MRPKGDWTKGPWNEGACDVLKLMWGLNKPVREIAAVLSALTGKTISRGSVISKAGRMGLMPHKNAHVRAHTHNSRRHA